MAVEVGISSGDFELFKTGGINSYSRYAFCCSCQPGSGKGDVLFDYLESILGTKPTGADASNYRRLFCESHALALKDLQSRLECCDAFELKIIPLAEKVQRLEALVTFTPLSKKESLQLSCRAVCNFHSFYFLFFGPEDRKVFTFFSTSPEGKFFLLEVSTFYFNFVLEVLKTKLPYSNHYGETLQRRLHLCLLLSAI